MLIQNWVHVCVHGRDDPTTKQENVCKQRPLAVARLALSATHSGVERVIASCTVKSFHTRMSLNEASRSFSLRFTQ